MERRGKFEIVDLRDEHNERLFDLLAEGLYRDCFPSLDEREDAQDWKPRLWGAGGSDPTMRAVVVGEHLESDAPQIAGFICTELYAESHCGLISYVGVEPHRRSTGVGRLLIELAREKLRRDADLARFDLEAVFAEIHNPAHNDPGSDAMDPYERVTFFAKLGAVRVPIKYVQPAVRHDQPPVKDRLDLVCLPFDGTENCTLERPTVAAFLREYFAAEGKGADDGDLVEMVRELRDLANDHIALEPLQKTDEEPQLSFREYAIAFHFIAQNEPRLDPGNPSEPFASFERDVFAYAYRDSVPFWTRASHVAPKFRRVQLTFAPEVHYDDEGKAITLVPKSPTQYTLDVHASQTQFKSGVDVMHLVLSSPHDEHDITPMNEYDVIKLIKLWEGGEKVRGSFPGAGPESCSRISDGDGKEWSILDLARQIFEPESESEDDPISAGPKAGIVQLVGGTLNPDVWKAVHDVAAYAANKPDEWEAIHRTVEGLAGIVQGIIDFEEIGADELSDVFAGVDVSESGLFGLHKGTLISVEHADRPEDKGRPAYPVSPYSLFPQAVLLNNDALLVYANKVWRDAQESRHLHVLQDAALTMRRSIDSDCVPNVFHYPRERHLYTRGDESRALNERAQQLRQRLDEINAKYEFKLNTRRSMGDDLRNVLLLLLAYTSLRDLLPHVVPGYALFLGLIGLSVGYLAFRWQGLRGEGWLKRESEAKRVHLEESPSNA